ncbi:MAG: hypothetical protein FJ279_20880, partial [Planctomycetes bacterium]|nr:hypothetical protein [Planctomycetota bacterium]
LAPGHYHVAEVLKLGWAQSAPSQSFFDVFVAPSQTVRNLNFGNVPLGRISGVKWNDQDGDGVRDTGEPGLADWTIYLDGNENAQLDPYEPSATTDATGAYAFPNLRPGDYRVAEVILQGWTQTAPATGFHDVSLPAGQTVTGKDFGNTSGAVAPARIEGSKWNDTNMDGVWDTDESVLADWTIYLDQNQNGQLDPGEASAITDSDGLYAFTNLTPGYYRVAEVLLQGWSQTAPEESFFDVFLTPGEIVTGLDFGNVLGTVPPGGIEGAKWHDLDADGVRDVAEPSLAGWTIYLDLNQNGELDTSEPTSVTDTTGRYGFTGLERGTYRVAEVLDHGWAQTAPTAGFHDVLVPAGQIVSTNTDFGNVHLGEIKGTKWSDMDGDGVWDDTEPGLPGWTIYLDANRNGQLDPSETSTVTEDDGRYAFTGLMPGNYVVREVKPSGWVQRYPASGFHTVPLSAGQVKRDVDFGNELDTTGPQVTVMTPSPGGASLTVPNVVVTFSEDLDPSTINGTTFKVTRPNGTEVPGTVSYSSTTDQATFTPSAALTFGHYRVWLDGGGSILDLAGNVLDGENLGALPSGDGDPGGDFEAGFQVSLRLRSGDEARYVDEDGDQYELAYRSRGFADITFAEPSDIGADIATITFTGASTGTKLTSTLLAPSAAGQGRTTVQEILAAGQPMGTLDFSLARRGLTVLNQTSLTGRVEIGRALTKLVLGGDLEGDADIGGKAATFIVNRDVLGGVQIGGNATTFKVGGDVLGDVDVRGTAGTVTIGGQLDAAFTAQRTITKLVADSLGEDAAVTSEEGSINRLETSGELNGEVNAAVSLVKVESGGGLGATLDAGLDINSVFAADDITSTGFTAGRDIKKVETLGRQEADLEAGRNITSVKADVLAGNVLADGNVTKVVARSIEGSQIIAGAGGSRTADVANVLVGAGGIQNALIRAGDQIKKVTTPGRLMDTFVIAGLEPGVDGQYGKHPDAVGQATNNVITNTRSKVVKVEARQYLGDVRILHGGTRLGTYKFGLPLVRVTTSEATPDALTGPNFLTLVQTVSGVSAVI